METKLTKQEEATGDKKARKVSQGLSHLRGLDSPTNSNEREAKRPCRSVSSLMSSESDLHENISEVAKERGSEDDLARSEAEENAMSAGFGATKANASPMEEDTVVASMKSEATKAVSAETKDPSDLKIGGEARRGRPPKRDSDSIHGPKQERNPALSSPNDEMQHKVNLKQQVGEMNFKVEEMEQQVSEILRLRRASLKDKPLGIPVQDEDREKAIAVIRKQKSIDNARREAAHAKRAMDLMRIFSNILRQITQHKWAWPFLQPVDVEGLRLHDYYDIIKKPMDFGTIREKMDGKDGIGYRNVQEIVEDVRLVFSNAMTYNEVGTDVHVMAKTLSEKFEEKWKTVLEPKLHEEEAKRKQDQLELEVYEAEEAKAAEEAAIDRMAHDICKQLTDLEDELEDLKVQATSKCRPMSIEEKRQLGLNLGRLPTASLNRVIQIIAKKNPGFNTAADEVEVDIDAQDTGTLWQLHCYVQMVLNQQKQAAEGADQTPVGAPIKKKPATSTKMQK